MSFIDYYSKMFDSFGDFAIKLTEALNIIILSYRKEIDKLKIAEAKELIVRILNVLLEKKGEENPVFIQLHEIFNEMLENEYVVSQFTCIRNKILKDEKLLDDDIKIIDKIIENLNNQATIAFRRMKRGR